jgi:hypothetical protein
MFLNYFNNFKYININIIFIYFQIKHTLKKNIVKLMESQALDVWAFVLSNSNAYDTK